MTTLREDVSIKIRPDFILEIEKVTVFLDDAGNEVGRSVPWNGAFEPDQEIPDVAKSVSDLVWTPEVKQAHADAKAARQAARDAEISASTPA